MNAALHEEPLGRSCPRCQRRTDRVSRHWYDRVLSLFMPVARYRCISAGCGWEGLLMRRHHGRLHATLPAESRYRLKRLEPARPHAKNPPPPA